MGPLSEHTHLRIILIIYELKSRKSSSTQVSAGLFFFFISRRNIERAFVLVSFIASKAWKKKIIFNVYLIGNAWLFEISGNVLRACAQNSSSGHTILFNCNNNNLSLQFKYQKIEQNDSTWRPRPMKRVRETHIYSQMS